MRWWNKPKRNEPASGAPAPFAFKQRSVVQTHRVKVRHQRGFVVAEPIGGGVGIQIRALMVVFTLSLLMGTMAVRLAYVGVMPPAEPRQSIRDMPKDSLRRGDIYDRNGVLLASTLRTYSLYADPKRILNVDEVVARLPKALPEIVAARLKKAIANPERRFVWLKRRMTPAEAKRVHDLGLPGLEFREEYVRVYPLEKTAAHVLGAVDVDNTGLAGVERAFEDTLKRGEDVFLAIDVRAQDMLAESVREMWEESESKAGWGAAMDAQTGEIIAMVSLPDFDPNHFGKYPDEARFNRAVLASYEMGSTFKIFTLAQGLANKHITPETRIDCREPIKIGRFTIKDYHAKGTILNATEILRYSSNIGAAKIADMGGPSEQKAFMAKLGMLQPMNVGVSEVGPVRYPSNWGRIQTFTIAFGHGMMVTPLHLMAGVAALATDGYFRTPYVIKGGSPQKPHKVLEMETVRQVRDLLRDVVVSGSGRRSHVVGYDIGGKTGTAEKVSGRGYSDTKNVVSFVASLPMDNPKYVVLVMLDEPKVGYHTGGLSAAPAVGAFIRRFGMMVGLAPDMAEVQVKQLELERKALKGQNVAKAILTAPVNEQEGPAPRDEAISPAEPAVAPRD
ncbi:MAG: penicillin-binding protein 2 [Alphaproteobacteria bacterium]